MSALRGAAKCSILLQAQDEHQQQGMAAPPHPQPTVGDGGYGTGVFPNRPGFFLTDTGFFLTKGTFGRTFPNAAWPSGQGLGPCGLRGWPWIPRKLLLLSYELLSNLIGMVCEGTEGRAATSSDVQNLLTCRRANKTLLYMPTSSGPLQQIGLLAQHPSLHKFQNLKSSPLLAQPSFERSCWCCVDRSFGIQYTI